MGVIRELILAAILTSSIGSCQPFSEQIDPEDEIIDPSEEIQGATTPAPPTYSNWTDWQTWEPPANILKLAPYFKSGYDYDNLPVYVVQYGRWNYRELAHLSPDELEDFKKHHEQITRRMQQDGSLNNDGGIVYICDWDGFSLSSYASAKALKLALWSFTSITRIYQSLQYGFEINTNFAAETFNNMARPFLGNIMDKFEVHGGRRDKWKPALLRKIPKSQLPPEYGGDKDWKPVPWN